MLSGHSQRYSLAPMFGAQSVAVIGATEKVGSVGAAIVQNLAASGKQKIYPVNPKRDSIFGIKAYPVIAAVPEKVDLAVIVTPATAVPGIIKECIVAGVRSVIIISAGFRETGAAGVELEKQILESGYRGKLRILGPNCLGLMVPRTGLNATFAATSALPGNVAFISQSGALCTAILDWSLRERIGFSAFVSVGSMLDTGWGDLIDYFGDDPYTKSIIIYMESIGDARSFLSAAREVALTKPIVVIKVGRTAPAAKAAISHTGALTGSDEVLDAAFRRIGVLRVKKIADMFHMTEVLSRQPRPAGRKLAIITNAGGPGALATDMLVTGGGELAPLSQPTIEALDANLPAHWSKSNPVDVLGDADPQRYAQAIDVVAKDPAADGILVVLTPQAMTDPTATAQKIAPFSHLPGKPIIASWMGGGAVDEGVHILNEAGIPTFQYPDTAAQAFNYMWRYSYNIEGLYETPSLAPQWERKQRNLPLVKKIIGESRAASRTILSEAESKQVLEAYGIPVVQTSVATTADDAAQQAEKIGFPVAVKLHSHTVTHKAAVGGVKLNLTSSEEVRQAFNSIRASVEGKMGSGNFDGVSVQPMISRGMEIILGSTVDPQFGPVLLFGAGGSLVEIFKDRSLALPPLNATLARRMMEHTNIYAALKHQEGIDLGALEQLLVRFSHLVVEQPFIKEIDINPVAISRDRMIALDARMVLHHPSVMEEQLPKLAIRPYPLQYVTPWTMTEGTNVTIRPIRPEDEPVMVKFHQGLSERTVHLRYHGTLKLDQRVTHERLTRICFNDYDREIALVAEHQNETTEENEILGVARLSKTPASTEAEFAIVISDVWQHRGLGTRLMQLLIHIGRQEKLTRLKARILPSNVEMQNLCREVGMKLEAVNNFEEYRAEMEL